MNEAGEYAFEIPVFPSGMSEGVQFSLTASLTGVPTADADIPLVVDNSLVTAYNNYYYTEYKTLESRTCLFFRTASFRGWGTGFGDSSYSRHYRYDGVG